LKKLDDLPTLAQLKELEDLRVQLTLPGADAQVLTEAETPLDAAADDAAADVEPQAEDDEEPPAENAAQRSRGLVASGAENDSI
jgi:hypothetical protein